MGKVDVLQFHTFGTPFLKSCSCCGSKESLRDPKSHFWARIDLEHTFMLINVSPNWLFRWRKMQNWRTPIRTHSVLMILKRKLKFAEFWGQKSTWDPSYRVVQGFALFFHRVGFLRRVPDIWSLLGAIFALWRSESIWSMLYSFKHMLRFDFLHVF